MRNDRYSYEDIIHMEHPVSRAHARMPIRDRAAQFSPFAALTGHDAAIRETARLTDRRVELDEYEKRMLDEKLRILLKHNGEAAELRITYFQADEYKDGGSYQVVNGIFEKLDSYQRCLVLQDGIRISLDDIVEIDSSVFCGFTF